MINPSTASISTYLDVALLAARAGGNVLSSYWGKQLAIAEKGRAGDLVTQVDKESEQEIITVIKRHCPNHSILAEESGASGDRNHQYQWVIDPLDGTTNYAHGYPQAAVSIALTIDGEPSLGVVYNPMREELWSAAKGLGATLNNQKIKVSTTAELKDSLLVTGFAYDRRETDDNNYAEFCYLTHLTQGVRRAGSASLDLCELAGGRLDGYWERGLKPWDLLAGVVIHTEAGGQISAYDGTKFNIDSGRILATNGKIHDSLIEALKNTPHSPAFSFH